MTTLCIECGETACSHVTKALNDLRAECERLRVVAAQGFPAPAAPCEGGDINDPAFTRKPAPAAPCEGGDINDPAFTRKPAPAAPAITGVCICPPVGRRPGAVPCPAHPDGPATAGAPPDALAEVRRALRCLYIAVEESVARDVQTKVEAALAALTRRAEAAESRARALAEALREAEQGFAQITGGAGDSGWTRARARTLRNECRVALASHGAGEGEP